MYYFLEDQKKGKKDFLSLSSEVKHTNTKLLCFVTEAVYPESWQTMTYQAHQ